MIERQGQGVLIASNPVTPPAMNNEIVQKNNQWFHGHSIQHTALPAAVAPYFASRTRVNPQIGLPIRIPVVSGEPTAKGVGIAVAERRGQSRHRTRCCRLIMPLLLPHPGSV